MLEGTPYVPNTSDKYSKHIQQVHPGECCFARSISQNQQTSQACFHSSNSSRTCGFAPAGNGKGQAPAANGQATAPATNGKGKAAAPGTSQTALGANGQAVDVAVLLQTLGRMEEQEKQQALLLEAQEAHYEDLEELEGTVEEGANILDTLEEDSRKARTTTENVLAVAKAARDIGLVVLGFGGLSLGLWTLSWKAQYYATTKAKAKASSPTPTPEEESDPAPAKIPSTVPTPAKVGIRKME